VNPAKYLSQSHVSRIRKRFGVAVEYVDYAEVKDLTMNPVSGVLWRSLIGFC